MAKPGKVMNSHKSVRKMWQRRARMLPLTFLLLIGAAALGMQLRMFVAKAQPRLDRGPFQQVLRRADDLSGSLLERTRRSFPMQDLAFLEPVLVPKAVTADVDQIQASAVETNKPLVLPPVPHLEGIMFSETEDSLAVFDDMAVKKDDVVKGWRVLRIEPEKVRIINDETGTQKVVILYENKTQE